MSPATARKRRQSDRRDDILTAAERCFVRAGFHRTSMHEICAEAGMSPGNLYRYFPSKEAVIAGIAERDRAEVARDFEQADLSQGLYAVLEGLARIHFVESGDEQVALCTEIMAEARRNPEIARISAAFDADVRRWLADLFAAAAARGDIAADADVEGAIDVVLTIADGLWWQRARRPGFRAEAFIPVFMDIIRHVLRGRDGAARPAQEIAPGEIAPEETAPGKIAP